MNRDTVAFRSSICAKAKISTLGRKGTSALWPLRRLGAAGRVLGSTTWKRRVGMGLPSIYDPAYGQKKKLEQGRAVIHSRCSLVAEFAASPELFPVSQSGNGLRPSLNHRLARILRDRDSVYGAAFIRRLTAKVRRPRTAGRPILSARTSRPPPSGRRPSSPHQEGGQLSSCWLASLSGRKIIV